ncbi:MAG: hypothetical protein ACRDTD_30220 [Pseudonocardiaceae bacterium]
MEFHLRRPVVVAAALVAAEQVVAALVVAEQALAALTAEIPAAVAQSRRLRHMRREQWSMREEALYCGDS